MAKSCWDCGSTVRERHTVLCDMVGPREAADLPARPGTQYWNGEQRQLALREINDLRRDHDIPHLRRPYAPRVHAGA